MKATVTEPQSYERVITVEIPDEDVQKEFQNKLAKYKKEVKLPGFRPGKVPANLLKSRFGKAIRGEAVDELVNSSFQEACKENKIQPVNEGKVSDLKAEEEGAPISYTITVEVDPEIEVKGYKKIKVKADKKDIGDKDVDNAVTSLQERLAEYKEVERPSEMGDSILFKYRKVIVEGELKEDYTPTPQWVELGKGPIKDFDKELIGLKKDEEKTITITFPKDYQDKEIAGKSAEITLAMKRIQEKKTPEINEEFLKKLGDFADEQALREAMLKDLVAQEEKRAVTEAQDKAIDSLIESNAFEVPPSRVEYYLDKVIEDQAQYYPEGKRPSREEVDEKFREIGIRTLKRFRILDFIIEKEKIKATQEEVDVRIQQLADQYQQPFEEIKKQLRTTGATMRIRKEIQEQKTLDSLIGKIPWESK